MMKVEHLQQPLKVQRGHLAIVCLALTFPSLRDGPAPGIAPWNPHLLALWANGPASAAGKHAAAFVLWVYARELPEVLGLPFDLDAAREVWDDEHLHAFHDWESEGAWLL